MQTTYYTHLHCGRTRVLWREPTGKGDGSWWARETYRCYFDSREAHREADRLNALVRTCDTEGCDSVVYPHETEQREWRGLPSDPNKCVACIETALNSAPPVAAHSSAA